MEPAVGKEAKFRRLLEIIEASSPEAIIHYYFSLDGIVFTLDFAELQCLLVSLDRLLQRLLVPEHASSVKFLMFILNTMTEAIERLGEKREEVA